MYDKKFKQVAHSVLLSVVKSYSPGMDLIKIEKNNQLMSYYFGCGPPYVLQWEIDAI